MSRLCAECHRDLPRTSYTAKQWSFDVGKSRCAVCVHGHHLEVPVADGETGHHNTSLEYRLEPGELESPFAQGSFRWVGKGRYTDGERLGQLCAVKWFKSGAVFSDDYFSLDIKAVKGALKFARRFNAEKITDKPIKVNLASVWSIFSGPRTGQKVLVEPFIQNYEKFNSNSGWNDESTNWGSIMQALSHFSYHVSGGNYVLCDIQGGVYNTAVVLSDPVILSRNREFGVTDLGPDGISTFFSGHVCNKYCRRDWIKPANPQQHFTPVAKTTMLAMTMTMQGVALGGEK